MKAYYELSYVNEFGSGKYKYFYCTEEQIKEKAKELFKEEVKLAVDEEFLNDYYKTTATKPLEFDEDTCKGYVVKSVGYTLHFYIDWKLLPFDATNKNIRNAWVLEKNEFMGSLYLGVYSNLKEAKKQMKSQLEKPNEVVKIDEDGYRVPSGGVKREDFGYSCSYCYWARVSYECDEYELALSKNILRKHKIIRLSPHRINRVYISYNSIWKIRK